MHGWWYGAAFAVVLLDASIIGASAVTLSTSYAFGDVFGIKHSLHRKFREAKPFYTIYAAMVVVAAGIVLIPGVPLGLLTTAVQALAGILLPSASVFLLLLCNDREVLGPWMNPRWLNIVACLYHRRAARAVRHARRHHAVLEPATRSKVAIWIAIGLAAGVAVAGAWFWLTRNRRPARPPHPRTTMSAEERHELAHAAARAAQAGGVVAGKQVAMLMLRGYLVVSVLLLIVKAVQLGHG